MKNKTTAILSILLITISLNACNVYDKTSLLNEKASITGPNALPENPLFEKALNSSINLKNSTMSTLYANKIAWDYANLKNDGNYPEGAILYEVTWKQKSDTVWFGGNIPKEVKSVERILYLRPGSPMYQLYVGNPLRKSALEKDTARVTMIAAQKIAISP